MRGAEACDTLGTCFQFTLQGFFSGPEETSNLLDMAFGIVVIIVLLNVVIAVVGDAWDSATDRASEVSRYCAHKRWNFLFYLLIHAHSYIN
jgi:hypothetical protein